MTARASTSGLMGLLEKSEGARRIRTFPGAWDLAYRLVAAAFSIALLFAVLSQSMTASDMRGLFVMFVCVMVFLRYPATVRSPLTRPSLLDLLLIVASIATFGNFIIEYEEMAWRAGSATVRDMVFGLIAIAVTVEACRRSMSMLLPLIALALVAYALLGPYLPGDLFRHQGFGLDQVVGDLYASMNGIFGFVADVFISYVMLFVIMGAIFERFGAGRFFIDLPMALFGKYRGGAAKASLFSSLLFGTISGSATANVMATGTFTIPLMKRSGYRSDVAGGVEAAVSTGGMFMPPVMGAGAFLMAEMLRIPYSDVVKIALVPALLYFFSILVMVHFEALRHNIGITDPDQRVNAWAVFRTGWYYVTPILVLFYVLFTGGTASIAALYAIASFLIIMFVQFAAGRRLREFWPAVFDGLVEGANKCLTIAATAAPVGMIVALVLLTGLAFKFSALMLALSFDIKWIAVLLVLLTTLVLGMGMTVTADYLIVALLAAPALGEMGIPLVAAHMTAFWFSQSSNVTPPVCMAAFAGSAISGAHPYATGWQAMKFSSFLYIMPFMFVYTDILMPDGFNSHVLLTWATVFFVAIPYSSALTGYWFGTLSAIERLLMLASSVLLFLPSHAASLVGLLLFFGVAIPRYLSWRSHHKPLQTARQD